MSVSPGFVEPALFHSFAPLLGGQGGSLKIGTILLVTASPSSCAYWEALLTGQKYEVVVVLTGGAGVAACERFQPDLILLSDTAPDLPVEVIIGRLDADPRNRLTPIVVLGSSETGPDYARAAVTDTTEIWTPALSAEEALARIELLLAEKTVLEQQAERTILSLAHTVDARQPGQTGHSQRVSNNAVRLASSLQLNEDSISALRLAGLLHDVGKSAMPDSILLKFDRLNDEEARILQQHPALGEAICAPCKAFRNVLPIIRRHHERVDASGYPDGLRGNELSISEQILQVVEFYDGLISDCSIHCGMSLPSALTLLYEEADHGRFDRELVYHFGCLLVGEETSRALQTKSKGNYTDTARQSQSS